MRTSRSRLSTLIAGALITLSAATAGAQAWNYPAFQTPRVTRREFNFGIASGGTGAGTSYIAQWREGVSPKNQLSIDFGLASPGNGADTRPLIGGQFAHQMLLSNAQMPFDLLFAGGLFASFGNNTTVVRIPIGVVAGHRFPLEGGMAITPYVHPRLDIDHCTDCYNNGGDVSTGLDLDIGGDFEFTPEWSGRLAFTINGNDTFNDSAFGVSVAWHPAMMAARSTSRHR